MISRRSSHIRTALIAGACTSALFLSGFGSRKPAAVQICADVPIQFDVQVETALFQLNGGRALASSGVTGAASGETSGRNSNDRMRTPLDAKEQRHWTRWAEDKLEEAQHAMDLAETDSRLRSSAKELTQVSTQLVQFYGYAQNGNLRKMIMTLEKVRKHGKKAGKTACKPL